MASGNKPPVQVDIPLVVVPLLLLYVECGGRGGKERVWSENECDTSNRNKKR